MDKDFVEAVAQKKQKQREGDFSRLKVLIVDADVRISSIVRQILESFGFRNIELCRNGVDAMTILRTNAIDFVISEWPMEVKFGLNIVQYVRTSAESPNKQIPIILLTGHSEKLDVEQARDSGVTEYLVKPFSAKTLSHRIIQVIDHPRAFIFSPNFVGPDRRRKMPLPPGTTDRRTPPEVIAKRSKRTGDKVVYTTDNGIEIAFRDADHALGDKVGRDVKAADLLSDENVKKAQEILTSNADHFADWVVMDISRLEHLHKKLLQDADVQESLDEVMDVALSIKSQAGTFGFPLATEVAKSLYDYTKKMGGELTPDRLTVIRKHIDTLYVMFHHEMRKDSAKVGEEVLKGLRVLVQKYQ